MAVKILSVEKGSAAYKCGLKSGDSIISIDSNQINDMLDYEFYTAKDKFTLAAYIDDKLEYIEIEKPRYEPFGCEFKTYLIDKKHSCKNKCMFCFIDQLPKGMRETLYFKDDDERLSFLYGNYITLTNLSRQEVERIKKMHISPINISVHTTNPELRVKMMTNIHAGEVLEYIDEFAEAGIKINAQIVLCPGINDGDELRRTLEKLLSLYPSIQSIAAVPFGMTRYRDGLYPLKPYTRQGAAQTLDILEEYGDKSLAENGERIIYPADELFLNAGREIPPYEYYEDFPQLENGVGMWRQFCDSFDAELAKTKFMPIKRKVDAVTGEMAYPLIKNAADKICEKHRNMSIRVHKIKNDFFGGNVTVTGLVTGGDIIKQIKGKTISKRVVIPESMLRDEDDTFLDDVTLKQLEKELNVKALVSPQTGDGFLKTVMWGKQAKR